MQLVLFSERCFHCIVLNEFTGARQVAEHAEKLFGTPCPLCGVTVQHGDLAVVMDPDDMAGIENGTVMWNRAEEPPQQGFAGFFPGDNGTGRAASGVAGRLRSQLSGPAATQRKQMCEVGTRVLVLLGMAAARAREAEQQGDLSRLRKAYQVIVDYGESTTAAAAAIQLGAWDHPIDKKLSMSCPCATLGGDPLRS